MGWGAVAVVRIEPSDVGRRVTVRRRMPDEPGRSGDVVGTLASWAEGLLTVIRRSGEAVVVDETSLVAGRVVAPEVSAADLQQRCAQDWQPDESVPLHGWVLRYHQGLNRRTCSALALSAPERPLDQQLRDVRVWYVERGSAPLVLSVDGSRASQALAHLPIDLANDVMVGDAAAVVDAAGPTPDVTFTVGRSPDDHFLDSNAQTTDERAALASLLTTAPASLYALGQHEGRPVATGRVHPREGWAGLTHLEVDAAARRSGIGTGLVVALARAALDAGAPKLWLQVERDNEAALSLYRRLGFVRHHGYSYRRLA